MVPVVRVINAVELPVAKPYSGTLVIMGYVRPAAFVFQAAASHSIWAAVNVGISFFVQLAISMVIPALIIISNFFMVAEF
jgi:hypothetical protein